MAIAVSVIQKNANWFKDILKKTQSLADSETVAGFPLGSVKGSLTYDNGASVLQVAIWNQFGTGDHYDDGNLIDNEYLEGTRETKPRGIPARPFMNQAVDILEADSQGVGAYLARQVVDGKITAKQAYEQIGLLAENSIRTAINDGIYEPNSPATVKAKKSSKPLIDTGKMIQSVTSVVRKKR